MTSEGTAPYRGGPNTVTVASVALSLPTPSRSSNAAPNSPAGNGPAANGPASNGPARTAIGPGLVLVGLGVGVAALLSAVISGVSTLVMAVVIGVVIGNTRLTNAAVQPGLTFAAKRVLRVGVVLLGLRLSIGDVADLGPAGLAVVAVTVGVTFFGTQAIGARLGMSKDLSLLVATGYSICGASAIAAVEGSTDADEEEVAAAIGLVTLFGSIAIFALPALAGPLGLNDEQFGAWAGASVHDVAQVAATASAGGASVVAIAMVVKLTRVLLLTPIVVGVNVQRSRQGSRQGSLQGSQQGPQRGDTPPVVPLFVAGFIAMVMLRTTGWLPTGAIASARSIEGWLFAAALIGLGSGVRLDRLRKLGFGPLVLGTVAWIVVASISYLGVVVVL